MKETLLKIKERLDAQLPYLPMKNGSERAVYIMTDRVVPEVADFPAIGLKDGAVSYELENVSMLDGADYQATMHIKVTVFVRLYREEDIVTGDGTERGVLDVAEDVKDALNGYNPAPPGGIPLFIESEEESRILSDDTVLIQTKELTFKRLKQVPA